MKLPKLSNLLFILSAFIPLISLFSIPQDPLLLIYTAFVGVFIIKKYFFKKELEIQNSSLKLALLIFVIGMITEALAWANNYYARRPEPALFHPQLFYDLLIGISQYGAWAIIWTFLIKRFNYSLIEIFALQGIYGVLLEQKGAVFIQGLMSMPVGIIFWAYVFVVYGSIPALAFVLANYKKNEELQNKNKFKKYLLTLVCLLLFSTISMIAWGLLLNALKIIPSPQPIWLRPLW